jgi:hypothetical protein
MIKYITEIIIEFCLNFALQHANKNNGNTIRTEINLYKGYFSLTMYEIPIQFWLFPWKCQVYLAHFACYICFDYISCDNVQWKQSLVW